MHGTHDEMAPITPVRELAARLQQAGAHVTAVYLPHTDHMFDLAGTMWSPAARVAFHTLERFLAVIADTEKRGPAPTGRHGDAGHDTRPLPAPQAYGKEPT